jgi:toxin ParE1/3/4
MAQLSDPLIFQRLTRLVRRYALSQEAEEDLGDIRAYYLARASARTTRYVMREITKAMGFLASTPGAGHSREDLTDDPVKFWPDFSYLIIYDPANSADRRRTLAARRPGPQNPAEKAHPATLT